MPAYAQQDLLAREAHAGFAGCPSAEEEHDYGAVFTRRWVVELILDLVGYFIHGRSGCSGEPIEPACGAGAFLRADGRAVVALVPDPPR